MYGIEKRIEMKRLIEAGMSKSATARAVGISRRTLYNWIASGELERDAGNTLVQYGPRPPRPSKLDPYKETIETRLGDDPQLSAAQLFREATAEGYPGGYGPVKRYVRKLRGNAIQSGDGQTARTETAAGRPRADAL